MARATVEVNEISGLTAKGRSNGEPLWSCDSAKVSIKTSSRWHTTNTKEFLIRISRNQIISAWHEGAPPKCFPTYLDRQKIKNGDYFAKDLHVAISKHEQTILRIFNSKAAEQYQPAPSSQSTNSSNLSQWRTYTSTDLSSSEIAHSQSKTTHAVEQSQGESVQNNAWVSPKKVTELSCLYRPKSTKPEISVDAHLPIHSSKRCASLSHAPQHKPYTASSYLSQPIDEPLLYDCEVSLCGEEKHHTQLPVRPIKPKISTPPAQSKNKVLISASQPIEVEYPTMLYDPRKGGAQPLNYEQLLSENKALKEQLRQTRLEIAQLQQATRIQEIKRIQSQVWQLQRGHQIQSKHHATHQQHQTAALQQFFKKQQTRVKLAEEKLNGQWELFHQLMKQAKIRNQEADQAYQRAQELEEQNKKRAIYLDRKAKELQCQDQQFKRDRAALESEIYHEYVEISEIYQQMKPHKHKSATKLTARLDSKIHTYQTRSRPNLQ
ncbi:hypothetical protein D5018_09215 [Parashewanella curva]|uniref:Uncharacterized protein n=1 Tax=Parashewanella curva TaxID=2338552 RepID=A0A3L8PZF0_9GAMM|nr:hypothetical protein [Parashewanella curva]RLV59973.1 hypothetical protein D5018_09215 [Parashewanella curva]